MSPTVVALIALSDKFSQCWAREESAIVVGSQVRTACSALSFLVSGDGLMYGNSPNSSGRIPKWLMFCSANLRTGSSLVPIWFAMYLSMFLFAQSVTVSSATAPNWRSG